jgi:hypothetical protein
MRFNQLLPTQIQNLNQSPSQASTLLVSYHHSKVTIALKLDPAQQIEVLPPSRLKLKAKQLG